jgi:hypothetical protein
MILKPSMRVGISVGIATGYVLDDRGLISGRPKVFLFSPTF